MKVDKYWYVEENLSKNEKKETEYFNLNTNYIINNPESIIVSLIPEFGTMSQIILSVHAEGKYNFIHEKNIKIRDSLYIQPYKGKWYLYALKPVYLSTNNIDFVSYIEIEDQKLISIKNVNENCIVFVEYVSTGSNITHNYRIIDKSITIGSRNNCDIICRSSLVSPVHAEMIFEKNCWKISVCSENQIVLVNDKRKKEVALRIGDIIYIFGLS